MLREGRSIAELRADALRIARAGVAAADPAEAVRRALREEGRVLHVGSGTGEWTRVILLAVGKAAALMAAAALERLGERVAAGSVTVPRGSASTSVRVGPAAVDDRRTLTVDTARALPAPIALWEAQHPIPDIGGMAAASEALALARGAQEGDLVLCLLSGGASALWAAPAPGLTLDDLRRSGDALLRSGAPIEAVNTVRKHLSAVAGGWLARAAAPATVLTLAISDVIAAPADAIGSGPTLPDPTSFADALEVVERYSVALPPRAVHHLRLGAAGVVPETPKAGDFSNVAGFQVILSAENAVAGAAEEARRLGYDARVVSTAMTGEARSAGSAVAAAALAARREAVQEGVARGGVVLLWGGETTVTVRGEGRGGRNQEVALASAVALRGEGGMVVASLGTDGRDGPTDAAGAIVDGGTVERGVAAGLDAAAHLHANDSYPYLRASGDLIVIGPTGTNVNDIAMAIIAAPPGAASA